MQEHDLTQSTLADRLGTGRTKLSDILNAKNAPRYKTLIALIEYFHCSADFLLGLSEYPREEIRYKPVPPFSRSLRNILNETYHAIPLYSADKNIMERFIQLAERKNTSLCG